MKQPEPEGSGHWTKKKTSDLRSPELEQVMESVLCSQAREKEYEELLSDLDNQVWKEMSDEWQRYLMGKEESPAV